MVATGWAPILRAPVLVKPLFNWGAGFQPAGGQNARSPALANYAHVRLAPDRFDAPYYTRNETCVTRDTVLRGHRTLAIVDLRAKPILPKTDARLAAALITWRHPLLPLLLRSGFLPSPHQFRFLVNVFDVRIDAKRLRWALTWADTDHL